MLDFSNTLLNKVSVHAVGNKTNEEELILSKNEIDISDTTLQALLQKFFLPPFTSLNEFYCFTFTNDDFKMNPLYDYVSKIFEDLDELHHNSINIAKHLYEVSTHPHIKSGDLFVAHFSKLILDGKHVDAIGIFKSENKHSFLKLDTTTSEFVLNYDDGINVDKLDKGCLIFKTDKKQGYRMCIVDKSNKAQEAYFWKESFLLIKACKDEYHQTKDFLNIAKNFVTTQLTEDFNVNKTDQIDILNRSLDYFKTHDSFDKEEFEDEVFQEQVVINSFRKFDTEFRQDRELELDDNFEISEVAVKKQARVFKSVLKLDRNFHIYIHGDKDLIEQGVEKDGRKYYKIYFEKEE